MPTPPAEAERFPPPRLMKAKALRDMTGAYLWSEGGSKKDNGDIVKKGEIIEIVEDEDELSCTIEWYELNGVLKEICPKNRS